MVKTAKKYHILCPNLECGCAISFDSNLINTDFAYVSDTTYKYFGALNQDDNISCRYCETKLKRGDIVKAFVPITNGPVYR